MMAASRASGTAGFSVRGGAGGLLKCMMSMSPSPSLTNGGEPHTISYAMMPRV
jgi:hypothetical protein